MPVQWYCKLSYISAMTALAKRLKDSRLKSGLTQGRVAEKLGIAQSTYAHWERGRGVPTPEQVELLAQIMATFPEWVMFGKHPADSNAHPLQQDSSVVPIPVYNSPVSAPPKSKSVEHSNKPDYHFQTSEKWLREWTNAAITDLGFMKGNGAVNEPTIYHGELVLIDFSCRKFVDDGMYVLKTVGDILQLKRVIYQHDSGGYEVRTDNLRYGSFKVDADKIDVWGKALTVVGRKLD